MIIVFKLTINFLKANFLSNKNQPDHESYYNEISVDAVLDTAKLVYDEELARFNQIESKTNISMAFVGILLGILISSFNSESFKLSELYFSVCFFFVLKSINLIIICRAFFYFYKSIKTSKYNQFPLKSFVTDEYLKAEPEFTKVEIVATYKRVINENHFLIKNKIKYYDYGNKCSLFGLILFVFILISEKFVKMFL